MKIALHVEKDGVEPPSSSEDDFERFVKVYRRRVLPGVGHCLPAEVPEVLSEALEEVLTHSK